MSSAAFLHTVTQRSGEDEDRVQREHKMPGDRSAAYSAPAHSPNQPPYHYSPTNRTLSNPSTPAPLPAHHPSHQDTRNVPTSPSSTNLPPISSVGYARESSSSKYYDPTTDTGQRPVERTTPRFENAYSAQPPRESYSNNYDLRPAEQHQQQQPPYENSYHSPVANTFSHPPSIPPSQPSLPATPSRMEAVSHSPASPTAYQTFPRPSTAASTASSHVRNKSQETPPPTRAHPMSLSSIMSGPEPERPASSHKSVKASSQPRVIKEEPVTTAPAVQPADAPLHTISGNGRRTPEKATLTNGTSHAVPEPDERDVEAEIAKIENGELSEPDTPGFEHAKDLYRARGQKRALDLSDKEDGNRKRRRSVGLKRYIDVFDSHSKLSKERFNVEFASEAWADVQRQEVAAEKERKKDMQRKRRREKTLQAESEKRDQAMRKAQQTEDDAEKERLIKEAQRADRKAKATNQLLQGGTPSKEIRELTPFGPNMEGGTMGSFQASEEPTVKEPTKRKGRGGGRARKSKEQKQAEKDAAAAAHAALERGDDLPAIAPKEDSRIDALKKERSQTEESPAPTSTPSAPVPTGPLSQYDSKVYNQLYEQIWKDLSRKDIPKVLRIKENSTTTRSSNLRKTAQLASKEARRWQMRTNKSMKDVHARAKRSMKEMLGFWKRNERDERDQRKMAEKQELENAKRAEAEREANRQKRKLNFLISQTELYSHFIGKKVKTADIERSTDDVSATDETAKHEPGGPTIDVPETNGDYSSKVTDFDQLDFDAEDETQLRQAAMANAQNAIKEAQDRARAFNNEAPDQFDDEDGEMNFQNPTSLQNLDIAQPELLNCQLKEYQLKGLNWLVNLYEQGINGILADEMGLGKTVQSISVMAYLAETHNIWGPFLVIAPASTLHNWQQEIARFVPTLKVVPYWGNAKDRKVLRKFWDRKHIVYNKDSSFHVLITSYQLVVQDAPYFQKMRWQYMILDEAQAIKSSQSSRWKSLLSFHCRNRLLLTGTPIQNNMQELWALLHFIMPSLFDSHDEFSDWFSKDIESHAQSNTKLNEDQLKRLHMILKPFMLRRIKKHVQKELGDKIELDVYCDLTYRQRAYYNNLRNKISIMDLIEKVVGDDQDSATLMNLVMQFRKVCNHPDLFERAETSSPFSFAYFPETASFVREGTNVYLGYAVRNLIEYRLPRLVARDGGRLNLAGPDNSKAGWRGKYLEHMMNIWSPDYIAENTKETEAFSWLRFADSSIGEVASTAKKSYLGRAVTLREKGRQLGRMGVLYDENEPDKNWTPAHALFNVVERNDPAPLAEITTEGYMHKLLNVYTSAWEASGLPFIDLDTRPVASAPPIELSCSSQGVIAEQQRDFFSLPIRETLYGTSEKTEDLLLEQKCDITTLPVTGMLPAPVSQKSRYSQINVPSMRRFVTDSGKLARLDALLKELKKNDHRVLLYFQMTRMIDLMEEYLTYRNYKYCRLDGSTKLEDRRDTVADFQTRPEIFIFLLSTRAGGLGINLTSADTVIFYDSDWNPTIDSQAMDRAHRLGQTKQVTVYRLITRGTIEERIRKRALQKEEVQRVVISGGGSGVDFNTRSRENRTKDMAMWLADDDQAAEIEKREAELAAQEAKAPTGKRKRNAKKKMDVSLDEMYHEGEGNFDDGSAKPSGTATPVPDVEGPTKRRKGISKKAKTIKQRLALADGKVDL